MITIKNSKKKFLILLLIYVSVFTACGNINKSNNIKYVDINTVVKETFLTDKGYSNELSKHISPEVFKQTNIYNTYNVNDPDYKKPFRVDFSLKEVSQNKENDMIYIKMIYSVDIFDSQNKEIGGSWNVPITFTVNNIKSGWYIIKKEEAP